jgi:hypothetical protein
MRKPLVLGVMVSWLALAGVACGGGGSAAGEPLVSGAVTGSFEGSAFTPAFGVAVLYMGDNLIALGDGPINCGSPSSSAPPRGTTAIIEVPALEAGTYGPVFVELDRSQAADFNGVGSNDGTLTLTEVTADTVAGSIDYAYTSSDNKVYSLSGTFQVTRCP